MFPDALTLTTLPALAADRLNATLHHDHHHDHQQHYSDVNLTTSSWRQKEVMAGRVAPPIIIILGTLGNTLAVLVLRRMRSSTSTFTLFFTALALSDLALIFIGLTPTWLEFQFDVVVQTYSDTTCKMLPWMYYSLGTMSAWFLVAMTVQRVVCVVWPHRKRPTHTRRKALLIVSVIVVLSFLLNSHLLYGIILQDRFSCGMKDDHRRFYDTWSWLELAFFSLLPFIFIIISNCLLIRTVVQASRDVRATMRVTGTENNSHGDCLRWMNLTLITVSLTFVLLTLPSCIMTIMARQVNPNQWSLEERYHFQFWRLVTDLLWFANSSSNFYLYILTGTKFREECKMMFCKTRREFFPQYYATSFMSYGHTLS